jgi:hypothetical protein
MKTIYAGLPFYYYSIEQERRRSNSNLGFYCTRVAFPPFFICSDVGDSPTSYTFTLISLNGLANIDVTNYFIPTIIELDTYYYLVYSQEALSTPLPYGSFYLQYEDDTGVNAVSEAFTVVNTLSGTWIKIEASNTNDLGDILYATGGFESVYLLNTQVNYPASETVEVGEEKDGEFIAEKLVTKHIYRISTYVNRAMQRCLLRLPQHDSITITDDVGNIYTPSVGNMQIITDWPSFDVAHVVIQFNDGENTAFKWTYDMSNIT